MGRKLFFNGATLYYGCLVRLYILIDQKVHKENKYHLKCLVILRSYILQRSGNAIIFKTVDVSAKKKSSPHIIIIQDIYSRQNVSRMRSS